MQNIPPTYPKSVLPTLSTTTTTDSTRYSPVQLTDIANRASANPYCENLESTIKRVDELVRLGLTAIPESLSPEKQAQLSHKLIKVALELIEFNIQQNPTELNKRQNFLSALISQIDNTFVKEEQVFDDFIAACAGVPKDHRSKRELRVALENHLNNVSLMINASQALKNRNSKNSSSSIDTSYRISFSAKPRQDPTNFKQEDPSAPPSVTTITLPTIQSVIWLQTNKQYLAAKHFFLAHLTKLSWENVKERNRYLACLQGIVECSIALGEYNFAETYISLFPKEQGLHRIKALSLLMTLVNERLGPKEALEQLFLYFGDTPCEDAIKMLVNRFITAFAAKHGYPDVINYLKNKINLMSPQTPDYLWLKNIIIQVEAESHTTTPSPSQSSQKNTVPVLNETAYREALNRLSKAIEKAEETEDTSNILVLLADQIDLLIALQDWPLAESQLETYSSLTTDHNELDLLKFKLKIMKGTQGLSAVVAYVKNLMSGATQEKQACLQQAMSDLMRTP